MKSQDKDLTIIAEVKTCSPYGFVSRYSWDELFRIAEEVGDIISIHTDARWGGSLEHLRKARFLTDKPILAKGIHIYDSELEDVFQCGADFALVVGRVPDHSYLDKTFIEPLSLKELKDIPESLKVVWNSRDLRTGNTKDISLTDVRKKWKGWLCQASNIHTIDDVSESVDAVLVGSFLPEFAKSLKKMK